MNSRHGLLITVVLIYIAAMPLLAGAAPGDSLETSGEAKYEKNEYLGAFQNFQEAAKLGHPKAMEWMGYLFLKGQGVARDPALARQWFEEASKRGNIHAMVQLGYIFRDGDGIARDKLIAINWFGAAAARGDAEGMFGIGRIFDYPGAIDQDYAVAIKWYQAAGNRHHSEALNNLGILYSYGRGTKVDACIAKSFFERAVKEDLANVEATNNLGASLISGECLPTDLKRGRELLTQSANAGSESAKQNLAWLDRPKRLSSGGTSSSERSGPTESQRMDAFAENRSYERQQAQAAAFSDQQRAAAYAQQDRWIAQDSPRY